jgi:putative transposase
MEIHRSYFYYVEKKDDSEVEQAIRNAAEFGSGFWKIFKTIRNQGYPWNHKKVYRVYKAIHFEKRRCLKKRLPARVKNPLVTPEEPNTTWSIDFVSDALDNGRKFRVLNIVDDFGRFAVAQEISMSMPADRVVKLLEKTIWINGKPKNIRCDNGTEFTSHHFMQWCQANEINLLFTQPGCPTQNSYVERFNGSYRRDVLDAYIFRNIGEAREVTEQWREYYNTRRPHEALGDVSPVQYRTQNALTAKLSIASDGRKGQDERPSDGLDCPPAI